MKRVWLRLALCLVAGPGAAWADFSVSSDSLELRFSDSGALLHATACHPRCIEGGRDGGPVRRTRFGGDGNAIIDHEAEPGNWTLTPAMDGAHQVLSFEHEGGASMTWRIPGDGYRLELELAGTPALAGVGIRSGENFRPPVLAGFGRWLEQIRYVALEGSKEDFGGDRIALDEDGPNSWYTDGWAGFRKRYWALMVRADRPAHIEALTGTGRKDASLDLALDGKSQRFQIYIGPVEKDDLAAADPALTQILFGALWFWLRWISFALLWLLNVIQSGLSEMLPPGLSWGLSIMLLSFVVHVLMRPLSGAADRLQDQVHEQESRLAPELSRIRQTYKGEQQAQAVMALYRSEGVHPFYSLKSLLGVAIVIPVFIGAFDMLAENIHLAGTGFLWIEDLSRPDAIARLPFDLPFFGADLNLLPLVMTALSVLASWLHRPPSLHLSLRRKQVRNMVLLAAAFFVLFYTFPAGMVLYWTTNNLISAVKGGWQRHQRGNEHKAGA